MSSTIIIATKTYPVFLSSSSSSSFVSRFYLKTVGATTADFSTVEFSLFLWDTTDKTFHVMLQIVSVFYRFLAIKLTNRLHVALLCSVIDHR